MMRGMTVGESSLVEDFYLDHGFTLSVWSIIEIKLNDELQF